MQIYVATGNAGKLRDFAAAAAAEGIEILPVPGLAAMPEPAEDAPDFAGNAALKAIAYSRLAPGLLVLSDDSGLEVDALNGRPGVRSARFADDLGFETRPSRTSGPTNSLSKDERNNRCLLSLLHQANTLAGQAAPTRRARFRCELALARDGAVLLHSTGSVEGEILYHPRGHHGFGYDPLFLLPSRGQSLAELPVAEKWAVSHRGSAFRALLLHLRAFNTKFAQSDR